MTFRMEGVVPVNKPINWTSHDVVARMRRLLGVKRIGHTGTLDPLVTGVLPLCIGRATRLAEYIQEMPKQYEAILTVGYSTDTEDSSGTVTKKVDRVDLNFKQVKEAMFRFEGEIEQIPPMYSAVKHKGVKLYVLARKGEHVERLPRKVFIHSIELLDFNNSGHFPHILFRVSCSKGTYIRTLCADIGEALGYPAAMSALVRTASGGISLDRCFTLEQIERMVEDGTIGDAFIPLDQAVPHFPRLFLERTLADRAVNGQKIVVPEQFVQVGLTGGNETNVRLYDDQGTFLGIFLLCFDSLLLTPVKVFHPTNLTM